MLRRDFCRSIVSGTALIAAPSIITSLPAVAGAATPGDRLASPPVAIPTPGPISTSVSFLDLKSNGEAYDLAGTVRRAGGGTIGDALVYVWQVDESGVYDRNSYRYHGVVLTDAKGRFEISSVIPDGYYKDAQKRRGHLHAAIMPPGGEVLSTELFFPLESHAKIQDSEFDPRLLVNFMPQHQSRNLATADIVI